MCMYLYDMYGYILIWCIYIYMVCMYVCIYIYLVSTYIYIYIRNNSISNQLRKMECVNLLVKLQQLSCSRPHAPCYISTCVDVFFVYVFMCVVDGRVVR